MGRRLELNKFPIFSSVDSTTSPLSVETDVSSVDNIAYDIQVGASVVGTLQVQFCNDRILSSSSVFKPINFGSILNVNGATDTDYRIEIQNTSFKWIKLKYNHTSGTGNISASISGLTVGA